MSNGLLLRLQYLRPGMQVIHRYKGSYPFSLECPSEHTYLQVLMEELSEQQLSKCRKKFKLFKEGSHANFIRLVRIYKEESSLHLLYEYFPSSLEDFLSANSRGSAKQIYTHLVDKITLIVDALVALQIKTDIFIQNLAVADLQACHLKLFVDPTAEFMGIDLQQRGLGKEGLANAIGKNKEALMDFYVAQKKRVVMEIQELLEKYYGQACINAEVNCPNFVISGSKLVFINRNEHVQGEGGKRNPERREVGKSPLKNDKECFKRELKQKNMRKIEQIKSVLTKLEEKHPGHESKPYPQADEIVFRPEEITNDKTAVLEENEYLQSLESELQKIQEAKGRAVRGSSEEKRSEMIKQLSELQEKGKNDRSGTSEEVAPRLSEKKSDKPGKYKMKITTSHQIEIEGKGEGEGRADQEAIDEVRSGKVSLSELPLKPARPKTVKLQAEEAQRGGGREEGRLNSRNSDIASKSRKINEIIEKISSKGSAGQLSSSGHAGEGREEHCRQQPESYMEKIRQAKQKAEQVLKDYKKKH